MGEQPKHISQQEADRLIVDYFDFAAKRGRIFAHRSKLPDIDDYESEAMEGLMRAARNFDPARGNGFAAYAGAVIDDRLKKRRRREWRRAADESSSYGAFHELCEPDHAGAVGDHLDALKQVEADLSALGNPRHRDAYLSRIRGDTVNEIADRMGVHETTVRRWLWNLQGKRSG